MNTAPVLHVMPDFGNAPFLWLRKDPTDTSVGACVCDCVIWDRNCIPTRDLWHRFCTWAIAFEHLPSQSDPAFNTWNWPEFHEEGLALARELKAAVGDRFRVVYVKPEEDPEKDAEEFREIK